ncbi:MAG: family 20 glycosylhydrolase [Bacteroidales bacterium]|nr:family 20 glycosylhydrolase [Bacteroidales bacterium]
MRIYIKILMVSAMVFLFSCNKGTYEKEIVLLPEPLILEQHRGVFRLGNPVRIHVTDSGLLNETASLFAEMIATSSGYELQIDNDVNASRGIILDLDDETVPGDESYTLEVSRNKILITSPSPAGIFYGIQTVRQLLPPEFESDKVRADVLWEIPCVYIEDAPRFEWRGMHLDVSRHFFPVEFVKRYIDLIAMHKMNTFHWHLVDDQGWRIEIKKYPRLTGVGAWRVNQEDRPWNARERQKPGEVATYGGYYTRDEIRDIVDYARKRFVTIVPEIEMPAHVSSAIAAYPEYSCKDEPITVPPGGVWPITDIYCAGKDETFEFLEDVLTEVMELFPSEFIHVGGDEADKTEWKQCPECQARIREEGLKDEAELQSYFIRRIEKFLSASGRKLIGWDEILEGGLAPGAAVMSWRGMEGGIEAARKDHYVVMTPGSHCYFDHYQGDPAHEPLAFGGYTTLKKVYSFDPVPEELEGDEAKYILGAQANLWTEYIRTGDHAEYMVLPRMTALAEVLWLPEDKLDWEDFSRRITAFFDRFEIMGLNYARSAYNVNMSASYDDEEGSVKVSMEAEFPDAEIHYTLDGFEPGIDSATYSEPLTIETTTSIKAAVFQKGEKAGNTTETTIYIHKAFGCDVEYALDYSIQYEAFGELTLVNGIRGSLNYADGQWQGFDGKDLDIKIDLGSLEDVSEVSVSFVSNVGSWIFLPEYVKIEVSEDGTTFTDFAIIDNDIEPRQQDREIKEFSADGGPVKARYVRVFAKSIITCPQWHAGAGGKAWLFVDEVIIN